MNGLEEAELITKSTSYCKKTNRAQIFIHFVRVSRSLKGRFSSIPSLGDPGKSSPTVATRRVPILPSITYTRRKRWYGSWFLADVTCRLRWNDRGGGGAGEAHLLPSMGAAKRYAARRAACGTRRAACGTLPVGRPAGRPAGRVGPAPGPRLARLEPLNRPREFRSLGRAGRS